MEATSGATVTWWGRWVAGHSKAWLPDVIASFWYESEAGRVLDACLLKAVGPWTGWVRSLVRDAKHRKLHCRSTRKTYAVESVSSSRRAEIAVAAKAKRQSQFRSKVGTERSGCSQKPEQKILGLRARIGEKIWCTLFGSWSIIYGFPLQLSHWVERFFIKRFYLTCFMQRISLTTPPTIFQSEHRGLDHLPSSWSKYL